MEHQFPLYTYQTLDNHKDIRLLRILPGGFHEAIRCELSIKKGEEQYEALSYTWGLAESTDFIIIQAGRESRSFNVTPNLYAGLRRLRREREPRAIWVDAICINQRNDQERNNQVSMMFSIYTGASSVCVWLGEAANDSQLAIRFIDEILEIGGFEDLVNRPDCVPRWKALKELMTRDWFTRRWVVQEIALARRAILHCGEDSVEWSDFADAVGLFGVRNHNISKAIKASAMYDHNPDLLGDLRALGATQLVEHTRNLFRKKDDGTIVENLLDLTTLVSRLTPFQAKQPHDTIYAVLSLARDAIPKPPDGVPEEAPTLTDAQKKKLGSFVKAWKNKAQNKAYHYMVDYKKDFFGVCRDFLEWTLSKSARLDILCHPWAPASQESVDKGKQKRVRKWDQSDSDDEDDGDVPTPMTARSSDNRDRANSQVSAADSVIDGQASAGATRDDSDANHATNGQTNGRPNYANGHGSIGAVGKRPRDDSVPSWIPTLSGGPWGKNDEGHYTRVQADPLVGGAATYRASGNTTASYAFGKGEDRTFHVDGFIVDEIDETTLPARGGSIPIEWLGFAGWDDYGNKQSPFPPDRLWRTLVVDRTSEGLIAPSYWRRLLKYIARKSRHADVINIEKFLHGAHGSIPLIVEELLRRMQCVVWGRQLIVTKDNYLGLAPENTKAKDIVCVFLGCPVPMVLRSKSKSNLDGPYEVVGPCYLHTMMDGEGQVKFKERTQADPHTKLRRPWLYTKRRFVLE